jgi:hypothetical protein
MTHDVSRGIFQDFLTRARVEDFQQIALPASCVTQDGRESVKGSPTKNR